MNNEEKIKALEVEIEELKEIRERYREELDYSAKKRGEALWWKIWCFVLFFSLLFSGEGALHSWVK